MRRPLVVAIAVAAMLCAALAAIHLRNHMVAPLQHYDFHTVTPPPAEDPECPEGTGGFKCMCHDLAADPPAPPGDTKTRQDMVTNKLVSSGTVQAVQDYDHDSYFVSTSCPTVDGAPCVTLAAQHEIRLAQDSDLCLQHIQTTQPAGNIICPNILMREINVPNGVIRVSDCRVHQGWIQYPQPTVLGDDDMWGEVVTLPPQPLSTSNPLQLFVSGDFRVIGEGSSIFGAMAVRQAGRSDTVSEDPGTGDMTFTTSTTYALAMHAGLKATPRLSSYEGVGTATIESITSPATAAAVHPALCSSSPSCGVHLFRVTVAMACEDAALLTADLPVHISHDFTCADDAGSSVAGTDCSDILAGALKFDTKVPFSAPTKGTECSPQELPKLESELWASPETSSGVLAKGQTKRYEYFLEVFSADDRGKVVKSGFRPTFIFVVAMPPAGTTIAQSCATRSADSDNVKSLTDSSGHPTSYAHALNATFVPDVGTARTLQLSFDMNHASLRELKKLTATDEDKARISQDKSFALCVGVNVHVDAAGRRRDQEVSAAAAAAEEPQLLLRGLVADGSQGGSSTAMTGTVVYDGDVAQLQVSMVVSQAAELVSNPALVDDIRAKVVSEIESGLGATAVSSSLVVEVDRTAALTVNLEGNADELKPKAAAVVDNAVEATNKEFATPIIVQHAVVEAGSPAVPLPPPIPGPPVRPPEDEQPTPPPPDKHTLPESHPTLTEIIVIGVVAVVVIAIVLAFVLPKGNGCRKRSAKEQQQFTGVANMEAASTTQVATHRPQPASTRRTSRR